jgi:putative hydrolase
MSTLSNSAIASRLAEIASLLESQAADPFRVQAYRRAAEYVAGFDRPIADVLKEGGVPALVDLPTIGWAIARVIRDLLETGRSGLLDRLRGESDGVEQRPRRGEGGPVPRPSSPLPSVEDLLSVDREYREKSEAGELKLIAPRRFNPTGEAWLPILHTDRGERHYTALFSNTARAHELGKTHDWVVLYVDGRDAEQQYTVITSGRGAFRGRRIVRGREAECYALFRERAAQRGRVLVPPGEDLDED